MFSDTVFERAQGVIVRAQARGVGLITAESCTGGLVAAALTSVPGASGVVLGGIIAYANEAKMELLRVPESLILAHGAVSEAVAKAMSEGAMLAGRHIAAPERKIVSVAVTGIAGPGGGSPQKPVGTVHLAAREHPGGKLTHQALHLHGDRDAIRLQSVEAALLLIEAYL